MGDPNRDGMGGYVGWALCGVTGGMSSSDPTSLYWSDWWAAMSSDVLDATEWVLECLADLLGARGVLPGRG